MSNSGSHEPFSLLEPWTLMLVFYYLFKLALAKYAVKYNDAWHDTATS
jgi:hypothetical protein